MPDSYNQADWEHFFNMLTKQDYFAPFHVVLAYCQFLYELSGEVPATPNDDLYHDVGIEMSVDAEFPAYEAAVATGFFTRGLCMLIDEGMKAGEYYSSCTEAAFALASYVDNLPEEYRYKFGVLLQKADASGDIACIKNVAWWCTHLEEQMAVDPNAPTSIFSYFLEEILGKWCSIFCPLGYEPYRKLGQILAKNDAAFKAAKETGLLATAISTYCSAAIDVVENWISMAPGVSYILEISDLACFVPYYERVVAEKLLVDFDDDVTDEDAWYQRCSEIRDSMSDIQYRGY